MQSSLPLLCRGCQRVKQGHGCGSQASAITLLNIAIYSSLTPNDYCTPLMRSVIFCPDSAGSKRATQKKPNSLALLRKTDKKVISESPASPYNFLMSCWTVGFKSSFRSSHKCSHLTDSLWNGYIVREAIWDNIRKILPADNFRAHLFPSSERCWGTGWAPEIPLVLPYLAEALKSLLWSSN